MSHTITLVNQTIYIKKHPLLHAYHKWISTFLTLSCIMMVGKFVRRNITLTKDSLFYLVRGCGEYEEHIRLRSERYPWLHLWRTSWTHRWRCWETGRSDYPNAIRRRIRALLQICSVHTISYSIEGLHNPVLLICSVHTIWHNLLFYKRFTQPCIANLFSAHNFLLYRRFTQPFALSCRQCCGSASHWCEYMDPAFTLMWDPDPTFHSDVIHCFSLWRKSVLPFTSSHFFPDFDLLML